MSCWEAQVAMADRGAGESVGDEIGGESEVEGVVGAVVLVVGGQGGEGGVVAVAPRPREVGEEGVSEELLGAVEAVGEMGAEAVEVEPVCEIYVDYSHLTYACPYYPKYERHHYSRYASSQPDFFELMSSPQIPQHEERKAGGAAEREQGRPTSALVKPPTLPCIFVKPFKGVEVKEHSQIFYTADTFVLDDHDTTESFVLEVSNELPSLKEGVHVALPNAIDTPFIVDILKGEGIT
ncbi:hypothetical protein Scep_006615 [Stephania cephalantha]|uniref:Uncharacterized protein n=1 Tax=Stephania cephalantha TaxID=152367 RepID=A0AAP0KA06_9MAGN